MNGNRLTGLARTLRRGQTSAEAKLWSILRNRQLEGLKFRRQQPIGGYIADFCCEELRLVVELDGGQHAERQEEDRARTSILEDMNYTVLRFWNVDVAQGLDGVVEEILSVVHAAQLTRQ